MEDAELDRLLERTALGDRQSFRRLYRLSAPKLYAVCLRVLQDRAEAEDALQDAYVKIWRYAERFSAGRGKAITWMMAICRNLAIDRLRSRKAPAAALSAAQDVADAAARPDEKALSRGEARRLLDCINGLGEAHARLVRIAYFGGVTYAALAQRDNLPLGTVKSRMRKAIAELRDCLGS